MNKLADNELVKKVCEENCSDSFSELLIRHSPIFIKMVNKYSGIIFNTGKSLADLNDQKMVLFLSACKSFNSSKNIKFSTWLAHRTRFACLNYINRGKRFISFNELPEEVASLPYKDGSDLKEEGLMKILDKHEDKVGSEICKMRYFFDSKKKPSWKCIAKKLNLNDKQVVKIHDKTLKLLRKKI